MFKTALRQPVSASSRAPQRRSSVVVASAGNGNGADVHNVVIIGSGPAGYTAAIYAARASLRPLMFEGYQSGPVGGQLMTTTEIENFPGFPDGVTGPELMERMRGQAVRWGAECIVEDVEEVDLQQRPFVIKGTETTVRANAIIVATGATAKKLNIPSEHEFWSRGISACAICDGASPIFKDQVVAVVGGGDTATEEAVYLTKYAKHVHLLVRSEKMRASKAMQERVLANKNITVHFNVGVEDAFADNKGRMAGLRLKDGATGEVSELAVRGLFYGIGHKPNSGFLKGQVKTDESGYVLLEHGPMTSVPGVFAAGDLVDTEWRQAITAAGSGCQAAIATERYLTANNLIIDRTEAKPTQVEEKAPEAAPATTSSKSSKEQAADLDITQDKHRGQVALRRLYHESDRVLTVLYTSPTCGPCRTLKPIFNKVVDEYSGKVHYVEIDIVDDPEIAEAAGVTGTPTIQMFKNKELLHALPGVKMKSEYRRLIEAAISK